MSTEENFEKFAKDPLSMSETDIAGLLGSENPDPADQTKTDPVAEQPKGESSGAAPGTPDDKPADAGKDGAATPETAAAKPGEQKADPAQDQQGAVVVTKDGRNTIPYAVLQEQRERAIRAERAVQDLTEEVTTLKHALETGELTKTAKIEDIVDPEMLAELREESPQIAETIDKLSGMVKTLQDTVSKSKPAEAEDQREAQIKQALTVEEAIEAVPKLVHVRTSDPAAYNQIAQIDRILREGSAWSGKPMQDRFAKAVEMYEAANGEIELPGVKKDPTPPTAPDEKQVEAKVAEAVQKAQADAPGPNTLSDIRGGGLPPTDEAAAAEQTSGSSLTMKMLDMTPQQIEDYLARL